MPYSVKKVLTKLAEMASNARRINLQNKRHFRRLPELFGSHNKLNIHPRTAFHIQRTEKLVGAHIVVGDFPHPQHFVSPQGVEIVAIPREHFLEIVEQEPFSLHGNLARVLVEHGKEVPDEDTWIEAHRRTLNALMKNERNPFARRAAHEYISFS